jgi:hypothetical protein
MHGQELPLLVKKQAAGMPLLPVPALSKVYYSQLNNPAPISPFPPLSVPLIPDPNRHKPLQNPALPAVRLGRDNLVN